MDLISKTKISIRVFKRPREAMVSGRPAAFLSGLGAAVALYARQMLRPWRPVAGRVQVEGLATSPLSVKGHFCERASLSVTCVVFSSCREGALGPTRISLPSLAVLGSRCRCRISLLLFPRFWEGKSLGNTSVQYLARGLVRGFACCRPWKEMACRPWGADVTTLLHPRS